MDELEALIEALVDLDDVSAARLAATVKEIAESPSHLDRVNVHAVDTVRIRLGELRGSTEIDDVIREFEERTLAFYSGGGVQRWP